LDEIRLHDTEQLLSIVYILSSSNCD